MAIKSVLNVETYLHCSQDLRGTQRGLRPAYGQDGQACRQTSIFRITEGVLGGPPTIATARQLFGDGATARFRLRCLRFGSTSVAGPRIQEYLHIGPQQWGWEVGGSAPFAVACLKFQGDA